MGKKAVRLQASEAINNDERQYVSRKERKAMNVAGMSQSQQKLRYTPAKMRMSSDSLHSGRPQSVASPADSEAQSLYADGKGAGAGGVARQMLKSAMSRGWKFWVLTSLCLLLFLLGLIALIVYLVLWVGMPTVDVKSAKALESQNGSIRNALMFDLGQDGKRAPSFNLSVIVSAVINNPNRMDLAFEDVVITAADAVLPSQILATSRLSSYTLPKQKLSPLDLPMNLFFDFGMDKSGVLPKDIIASCSIPPNSNKPVKQFQIYVRVDAVLKVTDVIKIRIPTIQHTAGFDCPMPFSQTISIGGQQVDLTKVDWTQAAAGQMGLLLN
ncbi:hypothetical protein MP228_003656 [Amoeboaphelidium protococcarum]|nr:hypothetical protein MP228_003656 [Amoeboaphelidium protococcarum]